MGPRVLVLSRNYPNSVTPHLGLWVQGLVHHITAQCEPRVIAPVPYCPPLPARVSYSAYRRVRAHERVNDVDVWHPRVVTAPGYAAHSLEATTYYWSIRRRVARLFRDWPFDLIHAHFVYPDGVVAARLGQHYRVPVLITEHAPWLPWMEKYPRVRRQAVWAAGQCRFQMAVSRYVRGTIAHFMGGSEKLHVVPVGVDGSLFTVLPDNRRRDANQLLYVGRIHYIKGVDVLLQAMRRLIDRQRQMRLILVGGGFAFRDYQQQEERLRSLAKDLGLGSHVEFAGAMPSAQVAERMRASALLVLPSRSESFGAVLVEALACGTPVVATRCGGPEDIVNDQVGVLAPKEDPDGLAAAIESVLARREYYDPERLRAYALKKFAWDEIAMRTVDLYSRALNGSRGRRLDGAVGQVGP